MKRYYLSTIASLALLLLLPACTVLPPQPETPHWRAHYLALQKFRHWRLEGKLGYRSPEKNGSAWINWQQHDQQFNLALHGPFGASATQISGDNKSATLIQAGREDITAHSPAALTEWVLGLSLPVVQLSQWVKGIPSPTPLKAKFTFNATGQIETLEQSDWQLTYSRFADVDGLALPTRIDGKKGEIAFTLIVKNWERL